MVKKDEARENPNMFSDAVIGYATVNRIPLAWSVPVLEAGPHSQKVRITANATVLSGVPGGIRNRMTPLTLQASLLLPATVNLTSHARVIAGVQGDFRISSQDAHLVKAHTHQHTGGTLTVDMAPGAAQTPAFPAPQLGPSAPSWAPGITSGTWQVLRGLAEALLPATAWIVMFLASRAGAFGSVGRRSAWRRMEWVIGTILVAHLVVSAMIQVTILEGRLPVSLGSSLNGSMTRDGLWYPAGYPAVAGGVVLFIALVLCAAGWWSRPLDAPPRMGRMTLDVTVPAAGIICAIAGFAGLAWLAESQRRLNRWPPLAEEIPLAVVLALACLSLAVVWLSGALARSLARRLPSGQAGTRPQADVPPPPAAGRRIALALRPRPC